MSSHDRPINATADTINVAENTRPANTPSRLISETIASERSLERLTKGQVPPQSSSTSVSPGWTF